MKKVLKVMLLFCFTICLTGCWDKIEINERAYVYAIGYDVFNEAFYEAAQDRDIGLIESPKMTERNRFVVTFSTPNLKAIGNKASSDELRFVLSTVGNNIYDATTLMSSRINRVFYFNYTKALIFSEEFARNEEYMKETIDNINRHNQLSRKVYMYVTEGTAKDVIETDNVFEPRTGIFLSQVFQSKQRTARYYYKPFEDILLDINKTGCTLLPRITPGKEQLKIAGSGVLKDYKFVGWLGEIETRAVSFIRNKVNSEIVNIKVDEQTWIPFIITNSVTKPSSKIEDSKIIMNYNIQIEGYLEQFKMEKESSLTDSNYIATIEQKVEESLKKDIEDTVEKVQKEYQADALGVGDYLSKFEPDTWDKVKDDWSNYFKDVEINVYIDAKIRRFGLTK